MKKLIIIIALTVWSTGIYAQKVFDEAVFNGMMSRLQTDPAFFKNEVDPSFILTFGNGATTNQESMLKYAENNIGLYKPKYTNLKVSQYGNTGIVTGTNEETFLSKANPSIVTRMSKHLFTYTFTKIKSNWIWVAGQHTQFQADKVDDEAAINKTIIEETVAGDAADYKAYMSHWSKTNKSSFLYSAGLFVGDSLWTKMDQVFATRKPVKFNRERSNMNIKINGSSAFVTFNQASTNIETGNKTYSNEERYLEKINDVWKFVNVTVRANNPLFTASTWKDILNEYKTDSKSFFNSRISDDFRYPLANGSYLHKDDVNAWEKQNILSSEFLEPVIFQSNDLAIVTGKHITKHEAENGRSPRTDNVAATYTFQRRGGKWMFVASQQAPNSASIAEEEAAIKITIEGETNAFKQREADKAIGFWLKTPYTSHHYTAKGLGYVRGANVGTTITDYLKTNPKIDNSPTNYHDYIIRINGNSAWATYISDGTSNGKKVVYNKAAYLEKTNGEWKMGSVNSVEAK